MTKFKTLKDMKGYYLGFEKTKDIGGKEKPLGVAKDELKQEATKRAKSYTIKANKKGLKDYEIRYWTARRIEVMEFNNLTEEDLK